MQRRKKCSDDFPKVGSTITYTSDKKTTVEKVLIRDDKSMTYKTITHEFDKSILRTMVFKETTPRKCTI